MINYDKLWTVGWWHLNFRKIWKEIVDSEFDIQSPVTVVFLETHQWSPNRTFLARLWWWLPRDGLYSAACCRCCRIGSVGAPGIAKLATFASNNYLVYGCLWYICNNIELLCFLITNKPKKGHHPPFFFGGSAIKWPVPMWESWAEQHAKWSCQNFPWENVL